MWFHYISLSVDHSAHALEVCCLWHSSGGSNSAKSTICIYRVSWRELSWKSQGCDILSSATATGRFISTEQKLTVNSTITTIRNVHKLGSICEAQELLAFWARVGKFLKTESTNQCSAPWHTESGPSPLHGQCRIPCCIKYRQLSSCYCCYFIVLVLSACCSCTAFFSLKVNLYYQLIPTKQQWTSPELFVKEYLF